MSDLYQIVYRSYAGDKINSDEIKKILDSSSKNNPAKNITGMLVFNDGVFLQLIEGNELDLKELYHKIGLDDRHSDLKIYWEGEAEDRAFSNWSMAYKDMSAIDQTILNEHQDILNKIFENDDYEPSAGYKLFKTLRDVL